MKVKGITHITFKEDPEKAVVYRIIPSADVVRRNKSGISTPSVLTFSVYKIEGGKQTLLAFDNSEVKMRVRKSTGSWENSINWTTKFYTLDSSTEWVEAQLFVNSSTWLDADLLDSKRVPVIADGTDGEDGAQGPAGAAGAIYLCRGEWNSQETYIKTAEVVHYVICEGYAYEPKKASVTGGNNPLADVQAGGTNWKSLGRYDVIATRVLLANFALIAGAVFWNSRLMSQYGTNNSGLAVNNYTDYSEDANGNETGTFHPNVLIDFLKGYLKAVKGKIGNFEIEGNNLVANVGSNQLTLNATSGKITLTSSQSGGPYVAPGESVYASTITLDVATGIVEAKNSKGVSYLSASGIFCNNAATQATSASTGINNKAAICGLGFGSVNKEDWQNENFIAGVYGRADNSGTSPAYGGFFRNLMAAGLFLKTKAMEGTTSSYLEESDSLVIGYTSGQKIVYLPNDGVIGRTIFIKQWWTGFMRIYPRGGQSLWDDSTENSYFDIESGWTAMFVFTTGYINGVKKEAWLMNKFRW